MSNAVENIKKASNPQRTKCTSTVKVRKWDDTHLRYVFFLGNFQCSRYVPEMRKQLSHESLHFLLF